MSTWQTCRFCKSQDGEDYIHYSTRHYAHPKCLVAAIGWDEALARLGSWDHEVYRMARRIAWEALACGEVVWPGGAK